ncbi:MAG: flagellar biosynthesis anti-sigma factor FlgM [Chloroflexi bacterium]|nr:flagellar biosynthesis anti-sigma factor FlgM [Chloroflexota bacterium]
MVIQKIGSQAIQAYQQKINKVEDKTVQTEQVRRVPGDDGVQPSAQVRRQVDAVQLSPESKELQKLRDIVSKATDVREEKVQTIKNQIQAGTYEVSAEKLAGKLLGGRIDEKA